MAPQLRPFPELVALFLMASLSVATFLFQMIVGIIKKGATNVFATKVRTRPAVLTDTDTDTAQYGTHLIVTLPSQVKLHCVVNGPDDKPLMLFAHGFPEFWFCWRHQLASKLSKHYKCVAFDTRGYGESSKPAHISDYTLDQIVEDIDHLITYFGYKSCILVGHDWGTVFGFAYSAVHPERVDRFIASNCPHPLAFEKHIATNFKQRRQLWFAGLFLFPGLGQLFLRFDDMRFIQEALTGEHRGAKTGTFSDDDVEAYKYTYGTHSDRSSAVRLHRAFLMYTSPNVEVALRRQKIQVKTLMIWGTKDAFLQKELAHMSREYIEDVSYHFIEGASHWVNHEEPERFNDAILEFLANSSRHD